jgi:undecaprenyl diphosphate synthase
MVIDKNNNAVPAHLAVIMDGNGRWAKKRLLGTSRGHRAGVEALRTVLRAARARGVRILTVYAFSSENWRRPQDEVGALMSLLKTYLNREIAELHSEDVKVAFIGRRDRLSSELVDLIEQAEAKTAKNVSFQLNLAVDYGGQWDIANAAQQMAKRVAAGELDWQDVNEESLAQYIELSDIPAPDLLIRTGGDYRISNFLLWQSAYTEFYFCETLWPDFSASDVNLALDDFSTRQRRFGGRNEADAC